jgi:tRNA(Arg) A34 adenosine deaminase TadA
MRFAHLKLALPEWIDSFVTDANRVYHTIEERMQFVIELSRLNVENATGGPFGAAVFNLHTNQLVAPGVNLVIPSNCSVAHAEILAITIAQQTVAQYNLGGDGMTAYELVTSTEPCAMCFGAILWSGVRRVVTGARREDAMNIGFDEGRRPSTWIETLESRGISVTTDVLRDEAASILKKYFDLGGEIYNGRGFGTLQ